MEIKTPKDFKPTSDHFREFAEKVLADLEHRRGLRQAGQPPIVLRARAIAEMIGLSFEISPDSRKRRVRELIDDLRTCGIPVMAHASSTGGYFLAADAADLEAYRQTRRTAGLGHLTAAAEINRLPVLQDAQGQFGLQFEAGSKRH